MWAAFEVLRKSFEAKELMTVMMTDDQKFREVF
jgi:hypothetical protein